MSRHRRRSSPGRAGASTAIRFAAAKRGHRGQELVDGGLATSRDVANEPAPAGRSPHEGIDDIVNEDEIPRLGPVPEDRHRLVAHDALTEHGHDSGFAVRNLARSVDVAERQRTELERVELPIRRQIVDDCLLRDPEGRGG